MQLLSFFKKRPFFSASEQQEIVAAIGAAEKQTSGEIRVFVEGRCRYVDPLNRAAELFHRMDMEKTEARNAVLIYVAIKDRQLAVFGDKGIHQRVGDVFWNGKVSTMISHFNKNNYVQGLVHIIRETGEALASHFPYDSNTDKNELPDDIVFGR